MTDPTIRTCPTCGEPAPADALFCPQDGTPLAPPSAPLIGRTIGGRYQVTKQLGIGGMGQVFLATQLPMKRPCALKVIRPDRGLDPEWIARFHREAENASRISHANVAQVYDSGEADGVAFLAMEFVDGEPLSAVLTREGRLSPRRTARIVWQVANALGAAHHLGIVHRDLKPENVMLTTFRDRSDFVKVVDFGVAKAPAAVEQQVTTAGGVVGTPAYMSPEQFAGRDVDGRSDVYALGLLTIRMLTGALPPVLAPNALLQAPGLPDPVGLRTMAETKEWPDAVFTALARALARDAKDRTPSVDEFFRQLGEAISDWQPPSGPPEAWEVAAGRSGSWPSGRGQASGTRRWIGVAIGVIVIAAVVIGRQLISPQTTAGPSPSGGSGPTDSATVIDTATSQGDSATAPSATDPGVALADSIGRLDRLSDPVRATAATAREAVALYRLIAPRLTGPELAEARYYAGRALVRLGREGEACGLLRQAALDATGTRFAEPIAAVLAGCPGH